MKLNFNAWKQIEGNETEYYSKYIQIYGRWWVERATNVYVDNITIIIVSDA